MANRRLKSAKATKARAETPPPKRRPIHQPSTTFQSRPIPRNCRPAGASVFHRRRSYSAPPEIPYQRRPRARLTSVASSAFKSCIHQDPYLANRCRTLKFQSTVLKDKLEELITSIDELQPDQAAMEWGPSVNTIFWVDHPAARFNGQSTRTRSAESSQGKEQGEAGGQGMPQKENKAAQTPRFGRSCSTPSAHGCAVPQPQPHPQQQQESCMPTSTAWGPGIPSDMDFDWARPFQPRPSDCSFGPGLHATDCPGLRQQPQMCNSANTSEWRRRGTTRHDLVSNDDSAFNSNTKCALELNPILDSSDWSPRAVPNAFVSAREPRPAYVEDAGEQWESGCES